MEKTTRKSAPKEFKIIPKLIDSDSGYISDIHKQDEKADRRQT